MNRNRIVGLIAVAAAISTLGMVGTAKVEKNQIHKQNEVLLVNKNQNSNRNNKKDLGIKVAFIGIPHEQGDSFAVDPYFNANGFASPVNEALYNYEEYPANQAAAMKEATYLHGGDPTNTCVFFQASSLRAIGQNVPYSIGYTTHLENWLGTNGWKKGTNFNYIQKGDICFASWMHTFCFMGWKDKAKGLAYVMGDEAFSMAGYNVRNMNGQTANDQDNWNNQYRATCYWYYPGKGAPTGGDENNSSSTTSKLPTIGITTLNQSVSVMNNPGSSAINLGSLSSGTEIDVIGSHNGWYEIYYDGNTAWIPEDVTTGLKKINKINGNTVSITSPVGLWMNSGPSVSSGNIVCIPYNTEVTVEGYSNGWYEVNYNGQTGWVDGVYTSGKGNNLLKTTSSNSSSSSNDKNNKNYTIKKVNGAVTIVASSGLCLNKSPFPNDGIINVVPKGIKLKTTEESSNGWYKVTYKGQSGWVGGYPYSIFTVDKNIPTTNSSGSSLSNGGIKSEVGHLTVASPVGLWMNNGPSVNSGNIVVIPANTRLYFAAKENGWYQVSYNGKVGWVDGAYVNNISLESNNKSRENNTLKPSNQNNISLGETTITSPVGLWMCKGPSSSSGNIICLPTNKKVRVINSKNGWYEVNYNGEIGWIDSAYTSGLDNTSSNSGKDSSSSTSNQIAITSPVGLWMNNSPSVNSENIVCIPYNTKVTVISSENGWYEVNYNGQAGWVDGAYTKAVKDSNTSSIEGKTTIASPVGLWMCNGPSSNSGNIICIPYGVELQIINSENGWYEVNYNGQTGWIDSAYCN